MSFVRLRKVLDRVKEESTGDPKARSHFACTFRRCANYGCKGLILVNDDVIRRNIPVSFQNSTLNDDFVSLVLQNIELL